MAWSKCCTQSKDPLTRGYAAIAASHVAMSALIRFAGRVPAEDNDRMCQNILGIGFASLGALGLKRILAEKSWIKLDGRAILGTAVGSTALGMLFNCATKESRDELPQPRVPIADSLESIVKIQRAYREHLANKTAPLEIPEPNSPLIEATQELPGPGIELEMISLAENIRTFELNEQKYQETYQQHYSQEPLVRPDTPALEYLAPQDEEFLSADETLPQEIIEESKFSQKEEPRASSVAPQKKKRRRK
jgi:hypothetical protein